MVTVMTPSADAQAVATLYAAFKMDLAGLDQLLEHPELTAIPLSADTITALTHMRERLRSYLSVIPENPR